MTKNEALPPSGRGYYHASIRYVHIIAMLYLKAKDIVVTTTFGGALHATLMPSISYAKYGQENGPFGPVTVELEVGADLSWAVARYPR